VSIQRDFGRVRRQMYVPQLAGEVRVRAHARRLAREGDWS